MTAEKATHSNSKTSADNQGEAPVELSARKARGAGLGIENKSSGWRFAIAAAVSVAVIVLVAVVTSLTV